jgi:hypothetical protein
MDDSPVPDYIREKMLYGEEPATSVVEMDGSAGGKDYHDKM